MKRRCTQRGGSDETIGNKRKRSSSLSSSFTLKRKRTYSPEKKKKIVLYISGHGAQNYNKYQPPEGVSVKMLSFVPNYGKYGQMVPVPFVKITRQSLDEIAMQITSEFLIERYSSNPTTIDATLHNIRKRVQVTYILAYEWMIEREETKLDTEKNRLRKEMQKKLKNERDIKILQRNIKRIQDNLNESIASKRMFEDGFKMVVPTTDRTFYLEPNYDESIELYPHYGLHIVDVDGLSNGHPLNHFRANHTTKKPNVNERWTYDYGNITYINTVDMDAKPIIRANIGRINQLIEPLPEPKKSQSYAIMQRMTTLPNKQVTLTEIVTLFENLGFDDIYFIDPTCRDFSYSGSESIATSVLTKRNYTDVILPTPPASTTPIGLNDDTLLLYNIHSPPPPTPPTPPPTPPIPPTPPRQTIFQYIGSIFAPSASRTNKTNL